ncbi:uncharacterized protein [Littorina saxatilis]|uniref:uncharacterized protein n=1 Tax=Littorina saxatilis TaxID=31220 RepID=UPI0038B66C5D
MAEEAQQRNARQVTTRIPLPTKFEINVPNLERAWKKFRRTWDTYETASRLKTQEDEYRTAVFTSCLGEGALDVLDGFQFEAGQEKKIDSVLNKFTAYCVGETCEAYETYKFHQRKQEKRESIDAYVGALRQLAVSCNFKQFRDRMLRDRIVAGIADDAVRTTLLQEKGLTLKTCIDLCRVQEVSAQQSKSMAAEEIHHLKMQGQDEKNRRVNLQERWERGLS